MRFLVLLFILSSVACGHRNSSPNPPGPCGTGVNASGSTCATAIQGYSFWQWRPHYKVFPPDKIRFGEDKRPAGEPTVQDVDVYLNFDDTRPAFRRFVVETLSDGQVQTTIETGVVTNIDDKKFEFQIEQSSCGVQPSKYVWFYSRYGDDLQTELTEIHPDPTPVAHSFGDVLGNIITQAVVKPVLQMTIDFATMPFAAMLGTPALLAGGLQALGPMATGHYQEIKTVPHFGKVGCLGPNLGFTLNPKTTP
jgi:hypothetical protein